MEWKCSGCQTKNKDTYICPKCGFDESKNYLHYGSITILKENDKASAKKILYKRNDMKFKLSWICNNCQTENSGTYICKKCGFDESRDYVRYGSITILQEKNKDNFNKPFFKGDNILMACPDTKSVFGKVMDRSRIKSIQIYNTLSLSGESAWDVSTHGDGSVLAWLTEDQDGFMYYLYLAADGNIIANENCEHLFSHYNKVECIEGLQYLNTENVTNMSWMFDWCRKVEKLDVGGFDTRNVTNMSGMFNGCSEVEKLDVSGFDTRNVMNMSDMFCDCSEVEKLDVSGFDTKNVTNMNGMFEGCINVWELDVSNFDTRNVTNMMGMFWNCERVQEINVSRFNTSNVTNMCAMFYGCINVQKLDLSGFDTRNVEDLSHMLYDCRKVEKLDVSNFDVRNAKHLGPLRNHLNKKQLLRILEKEWKV